MGAVALESDRDDDAAERRSALRDDRRRAVVGFRDRVLADSLRVQLARPSHERTSLKETVNCCWRWLVPNPDGP